MKELKYVEKLRSEESLLSLPQSLSQVLSMVGTDDYSMEDLSQVIMKDPGLTSRILKMANSSFYGHRSKISTLHQAVMMLGIMQVKCLALSASVFQTGLLESKYHIDFKDLFSHFISVAIGCKMLADTADCESQEEYFIAGLLHDIGLVFFIHHFPDDYGEVLEKAAQYPSLVEAERDLLGIDHAAIGKMLAEKWGFPEMLCRAIGEHHDVPETIDEIEMPHIVQMADLLSTNLSNDNPAQLEKRLAATNQLTKLMKIDRQRIDEISYSLLNKTISTAEYLGIDIGDPNEILGRANRELFNSFLTIENLFRERQDLSRRILIEERRSAVMETKNVAIATLSHYINNAVMAISGRAQLIKMLMENGAIIDNEQKLNPVVDVVEKSVRKIMAVLYELRELTNLEEMEKYSESKALNIDDRIKRRLLEMEGNPAAAPPEEIVRR